jgi:hypothetical protein
MDFIDKVKRLKEMTKSPEVRSLCEGFLNGSSRKDALLEGLSNPNVQDENVSFFLRESTNFHQEVKNSEMEASKKAAQSLFESWNTKTYNNSGTWVKNEEDNSESISSLNESLSETNDKSAAAFLAAESLKNMGVLESVSELLNSPIAQHAQAKIMLENYKNILVNKRVPEYAVIENFVADLSKMSWDKKANSICQDLKTICESYEREIRVSKVIDSIKNSGSREFYSDLYENLNSWMISPSKSNGLLVNQISKYSFNPVVRDLINYLNVNESKNDSSRLSIPSVNQNESYVTRVFSPVANVQNENFAFGIDGIIFEASEDGFRKISNKEAQRIYGNSFINLLNVTSRPDVKINESGISFSVGKKTFRISEGIGEEPFVYMGSQKLTFRNVNEMAKIVSLEISSITGISNLSLVNDIATVYENFHSIMELDFAKSVVSKIYEGLRVNLMKWNGRIYLQRVNESMGENSVFPVTSLQAVKMVKESLRYDISEGLSEFLDGELRNKAILVNDREKILENIQKVEDQISKLEREISNNPAIAKAPQILEAQKILSREVNVLRNKWSTINEEIEKLEYLDAETELFVTEADKFNTGDYVKIKESGETGKIISVDGTSGEYTVLTDAGRTENHRVDEIEDLETALSNAGKDNEEYADDDSEEMKESKNPLAKAPVKGAKSKSKPQQPSTVAAPGNSNKKPMSKDLKNIKAANYAEGVDGQKPTDFEVQGYEIGYNLDESNDKEDQSNSTFAEAPGASKEPKIYNEEALNHLAKAHNFANAGAKEKGVDFSIDDLHGYRSIEEATKGEVTKADPNLAVAPTAPKGSKVPAAKKEKSEMAVAPSKLSGLIDFGVSDEIGYNLDEADLQKKN